MNASQAAVNPNEGDNIKSPIIHAVIPVAGFGTRMLPLSKAVPKELLPLADRPAIAYVLDEALACGITNIVLVNHAQKSAIEHYFDINAELDSQLRAKGKTALADNLLPPCVNIMSVRQGRPLGLGHAVLQARAAIGDRPFAVLLPDVILDPFVTDYARDNLAFMLKNFAKTGRNQILLDAVAQSDIEKYGIARLDSGQNARKQRLEKSLENRAFAVSGFVEKPPAALAPSNLAVVGRYVFTPQIFDYLATARPGVGGEIQLTDAVDSLIATQGLDGVSMVGASFDVGAMTSYVRAFGYFAQQRGFG